MQEADLRTLKGNLADSLFEKSPKPKPSKEQIQAAVDQEFRRMTDEQKILSLSEDEVQLLLDFRKWASSADSASGVFHWRKHYGKK